MTMPCPSGIEPSTPTNLPSLRIESIWCSASWYWRARGQFTAQREARRAARTGYRSRGENGPPYLSTSFRHFFTVDSLFDWAGRSGGNMRGASEEMRTMGISSSDTGSLESSRR